MSGGWSGAVLGVFAQPRATHPLRLQSEQREISQALSRSRFRDAITFDALAAATIDDVRRALLSRHYDVVHFAGHGDFDAPLIRWLVAAAADLGVPKMRLSPELVRREAKAAKAALLGASTSSASTTIQLDRLLATSASVEQPVDGDGAEAALITLTVSVLEELGAGALALEDDDGAVAPPNPLALAQLLRQAGVRVVVLNACETEYQGKLLQQQGVPFVVATGSALSDQCAAEYARAFYDYLFNSAATEAIEQAAHSHALLALRLKSLAPARHGAPTLLAAEPALAQASADAVARSAADGSGAPLATASQASAAMEQLSGTGHCTS